MKAKAYCAVFIVAIVSAVSLSSGAAFSFDVTDYGAKPDGVTDNTAAIQKAIDECSAKGGGRVLVPGGGRYMTYTLSLKDIVDSNISRISRTESSAIVVR